MKSIEHTLARSFVCLAAAALVAMALVDMTSVVTAANAPMSHWKTEKDSLSLMAGDQVLYTLHFSATEGFPYIHPLSLPGGPVMTALAPHDHHWHRGIWFSWKFINGVNYWEYSDAHPDRPDGTTAVIGTPKVETTDHGATVAIHLEYSSDKPVMKEERTLAASSLRNDGSYTIDWTSCFTALDHDVVLDRTPPKVESWGGYGGLGFRGAKSIHDIRAIDSEGRQGKTESHGKASTWIDFSGAFGEKDQTPFIGGVAIFDHPTNPRHPTVWYLSDTTGLPYFGTAMLFDEPYTLKSGQSLTLKYRILVHPNRGDRAALEKEWAAFAK